MQPHNFYVVTPASRGVRIGLIDPAGKKEWVQVRSVASREFADCAQELAFMAIEAALQPDLTPAERKYAIRQNRARLAASLIADASFDIDPVELMRINPRLRRQIETIAENDSLHFGVKHD